MATDSDVQKAVELLNYTYRHTVGGNLYVLHENVQKAIALLSPPPLTRGQRMANEVDELAVDFADNNLRSAADRIRAIARILRENNDG